MIISSKLNSFKQKKFAKSNSVVTWPVVSFFLASVVPRSVRNWSRPPPPSAILASPPHCPCSHFPRSSNPHAPFTSPPLPHILSLTMMTLSLSPTSSPLSLHHRSLKQQDGDVTIHFHKSSSRSLMHSSGESSTLTKSSEAFFRALGPKSPYKVGAKFELVDKAGQDHLPRKLRPRSGKVTSNPKKMSRNLVNEAPKAHPSDHGLLQMEPGCQGWRRVQGPSDTDLRKERHRASSPLRQ